MGLNSKLIISATADLTKIPAGLDGVEARVALAKAYQAVLTPGVAAGMADEIYHKTRTIAGATNDDLDLTGVLTDPLGDPVTFVKVKGLIVSAAAANVNNAVVGAAAANAWAALLNATGTLTVRPGATVAVFAGQADAAGYAVVAGTGDILRIANAAGLAIVVDVIILGTAS